VKSCPDGSFKRLIGWLAPPGVGNQKKVCARRRAPSGPGAVPIGKAIPCAPALTIRQAVAIREARTVGTARVNVADQREAGAKPISRSALYLMAGFGELDGPEPSRPRRVCATKRSLDGEDRSAKYRVRERALVGFAPRLAETDESDTWEMDRVSEHVGQQEGIRHFAGEVGSCTILSVMPTFRARVSGSRHQVRSGHLCFRARGGTGSSG